jgi:hypothetical protein
MGFVMGEEQRVTALARVLVRPRWRGITTADVLVVAGYVLAALLLYVGLWGHLGSGYLVASVQDQNLFEWLFAAQAHAVAEGRSWSPTCRTPRSG